MGAAPAGDFGPVAQQHGRAHVEISWHAMIAALVMRRRCGSARAGGSPTAVRLVPAVQVATMGSLVAVAIARSLILSYVVDRSWLGLFGKPLAGPGLHVRRPTVSGSGQLHAAGDGVVASCPCRRRRRRRGLRHVLHGMARAHSSLPSSGCSLVRRWDRFDIARPGLPPRRGPSWPPPRRCR